jgi:hypothetical protein
MARDRNRTDDQISGPERGRQTDMNEERVRGGAEEDVRGLADEGDGEFEDTDALDEDEDEDESY